MSQKIEKLMEVATTNFDSKHRLNTTNKTMPSDLLDSINNGSVTIEVLDDYIKRGFDIYKYRTQITIHGKCNSTLEKYVNGYASLVKNDNGSIGCKWVAIDCEKRSRIYELLKYDGWSYESNSTESYCCITSKTKDELIDRLQKIDKSLFYGSASVSYYNGMGMLPSFYMLRVNILGVYEKNVDALISNLSGKPINELRSIKAQKDEERMIEQQKWNAEYEKRQAEAKERLEASLKDAQAKRDAFIKDKLDGYVKADESALHKGDDIQFYIIQKCRFENAYKFDCGLGKVHWKNGGRIRIMPNLRQFDAIEMVGDYGLYRKVDAEPIHKTDKVSRDKDDKVANDNVTRGTTQKIAAAANNIQIIDYSDRCIAVVGNTYAFREQLSKIGGKWNRGLRCGSGWVFSKSKEKEVRQVLAA